MSLKEDKMENQSMNERETKEKSKPFCYNLGVPTDCLPPVEFTSIPESYSLDDKIEVEYTVIKTFKPKSGDWVGLFRCCKNIEKCFDFVGFRWAQKKPAFPNYPTKRKVDFFLQDMDLIPSDDKYMFLYLTNNERIIGQSTTFTFKHTEGSLPEEPRDSFEKPGVCDEVENLEMPQVLLTQPEEKEKKQETKKEKKRKRGKKAKKVNDHQLTSSKNDTTTTATITTTTTTTITTTTATTTLTPTTPTSSTISTISNKINKPNETTTNTKQNQTPIQTTLDTKNQKKEKQQKGKVASLVSLFERLISGVEGVDMEEKKMKVLDFSRKLVDDQLQEYLQSLQASCQCQLCQKSKLIGPHEEKCTCTRCFDFKYLNMIGPHKKHCTCSRCLEPLALTQHHNYCFCLKCKEKLKNQSIPSTGKNWSYYFQPGLTGSIKPASEEAFDHLFQSPSMETVSRKEELKQKVLQLLKESANQAKSLKEKAVDVRKAATEMLSMLEKASSEQVKITLNERKSLQTNSFYNSLLDIDFRELKDKLKTNKSIQIFITNKKGEKRNSRILSNVYSGSQVGLNSLYSNQKQEKNNNKQKIDQQLVFTSDGKQKKRVKKANYSIRLMYGSKKELSSSAPNMTLKKLFEDICTNETLIVDVAKDRSIIIQPLNNQTLNQQDKKFILNPKTLENAQTLKKLGLLSTTSDVINKLNEDSQEQELFHSSSYPIREKDCNKIKQINALLQDYKPCQKNVQNIFESCSSSSVQRDKMSNLSMRVETGSLEKQVSSPPKSDVATRLALLDSFELVAPENRKALEWRKKIKKDHSSKLLLIRNIISSNLTDEVKIVTLKQIFSACPLLSQVKGQEPMLKKRTQRKVRLMTNEYESDSEGSVSPTSTNLADREEEEEEEEEDQSIFIEKKKKKKKRAKNGNKKQNFKQLSKSKSTQTDDQSKNGDKNETGIKVPRLVKKPLVLNLPSSDHKGSATEEDGKMKPILKKRSSQSVASERPHTPIFDSNDASIQCNFQLELKKDEDELIGGNFKRERKVSFNTIILTSLFDNEEGDDIGKNKKYLTKSGKSTWPPRHVEDPKEKQIPLIHQFLDLVEKEVKTVTDNATEMQNSITNAVKLLKTEASSIKDKYSRTLSKALANLNSHEGIFKGKGTAKEKKLQLKTVRSRSFDNMEVMKMKEESSISSRTHPLQEISSGKDHSIQVTKSQIKEEIKESNLLTEEKLNDSMRKDLELQNLLHKILKKLSRENQKDMGVEKEEFISGQKANGIYNLQKTGKLEEIESEGEIEDHIMSRKKALKFNHSRGSSFNQDLISQPIVSPYSPSPSFPLETSHLPLLSVKSHKHQTVDSPSSSILNSFDNTISSIVKLYNNMASHTLSTSPSHSISKKSQDFNDLMSNMKPEPIDLRKERYKAAPSDEEVNQEEERIASYAERVSTNLETEARVVFTPGFDSNPQEDLCLRCSNEFPKLNIKEMKEDEKELEIEIEMDEGEANMKKVVNRRKKKNRNKKKE